VVDAVEVRDGVRVRMARLVVSEFVDGGFEVRFATERVERRLFAAIEI